jgi:hypothetical protein
MALTDFNSLFAAGLGAVVFLYLNALWRNLMATLDDIKAAADKASADLDTKLAAKDATIADLTTQLAAAKAEAVDPAKADAIVATLTAMDAKLTA